MDEQSLIEQYRAEMMRLYGGRTGHSPRAVETAAQTAAQSPSQSALADGNEGGLSVRVTTVRGLYPVEGAQVEVFAGFGENSEVLQSAITDQNGKTPVFRLPTPAKGLSESAGQSERPYAEYSVSVKSDGYREQIHRNIPVFPGVQSVQSADLTLLSAAGEDTGPQIFDAQIRYDL